MFDETEANTPMFDRSVARPTNRNSEPPVGRETDKWLNSLKLSNAY
jgi:hypothetical protein